MAYEENIFLYIAIMVGAIMLMHIAVLLVRSGQEDSSKTRLKDLYGTKRTAVSVVTDDDKYKFRFRDYYVKSSYNSCLGGDIQNGWVNLESLKQIIKQGCRFIDLEIYKFKGAAVVAASKDDNYNIKGTINQLAIGDVIETINRNAFNSGGGDEICPNPSDPLIINLRIKSNVTDIYNEIATALLKMDNLLSKYDKKYAFECCGKNLGNAGLQQLMKKVIIVCDRTNSNYRGSKLEELVNMNSQSIFLHTKRISDIIYATEPSANIVTFNKKNMTILLPDLAPLAINAGNEAVIKMQAVGCQFICMNFQSSDPNMIYYNKFFDDNLSAFVLKPKPLRYVKTYIPVPTPPNPHLSYGGRGIAMPQYEGKM